MMFSSFLFLLLGQLARVAAEEKFLQFEGGRIKFAVGKGKHEYSPMMVVDTAYTFLFSSRCKENDKCREGAGPKIYDEKAADAGKPVSGQYKQAVETGDDIFLEGRLFEDEFVSGDKFAITTMFGLIDKGNIAIRTDEVGFGFGFSDDKIGVKYKEPLTKLFDMTEGKPQGMIIRMSDTHGKGNVSIGVLEDQECAKYGIMWAPAIQDQKSQKWWFKFDDISAGRRNMGNQRVGFDFFNQEMRLPRHLFEIAGLDSVRDLSQLPPLIFKIGNITFKLDADEYTEYEESSKKYKPNLKDGSDRAVTTGPDVLLTSVFLRNRCIYLQGEPAAKKEDPPKYKIGISLLPERSAALQLGVWTVGFPLLWFLQRPLLQ